MTVVPLTKSAANNRRTPEQFAKMINEKWQEQVSSIIQVGLLLQTAKEELKHGEWGKFIKENLSFEASTVRKLMAIADHEGLSNRATWHDLPAAWRIIYELTHLTSEQFEAAMAAGKIHPKMSTKDAKALRGEPANPKKAKPTKPADVEKDVATLCAELKGIDAAHTLDREIRKRLFLALGEAMGLDERDFGMFRLSIGKGAKR